MSICTFLFAVALALLAPPTTVPPETIMPELDTPAPERSAEVRAALLALGWPPKKIGIDRQRPDLGEWQAFLAFPLAPDTGKTQIWAWVAPTGEVVLGGQPLSRASLRAVADQEYVDLRKVAELVVQTAGTGRPIGAVLTGDPMESYPGKSSARAPHIESAPSGRRLVFWARTHDGAPQGLAVELDGGGNVTLIEQPGPTR